MPISKKYLDKIKETLHDYAIKRREIIRESGDALHSAKRAIFSMHRDNMKEAEEKIKEAEDIFEKLQTKFESDPKTKNEGSYRAGLEEYVEAKLFFQFITDGKLSEIKNMQIEPETYIAGLCDVPGELYRYAIKAATERNIELVKKCSEMANEIIGELIEFNLTSYLRTKFDQAKQANQKLERVVYEVSLRN